MLYSLVRLSGLALLLLVACTATPTAAPAPAMIRVLADKTQLSDEDSRQTYALLVERTRSIKCDLSLTPDELQKVVDYIVEMGDLPAPGPDPRRIIDATLREQGVARLGR